MSIDDTLFSGDNANFLDLQYAAWLTDPASVDAPWQKLFSSWERPNGGRLPIAPDFVAPSIFGARAVGASDASAMAAAALQAKVVQLILAYRVRGHVEADLDPLGKLSRGPVPELQPSFFEIGDAELDLPVAGFPVKGEPKVTTTRSILKRLRAVYCGHLGVEYMNIQDIAQRRWLQERLETLPEQQVLDKPQTARVLRKLSDAENFERMLHNKFPGTKRFSLEGAETVVPLLDQVITESAQRGVREIVVGMAHRGRLNVLANVMGKPVGMIVGEFNHVKSDSYQGSGDVKYHLGYSSDTVTPHGHRVHLSLTPNPSHLEAVDPIVEGRVRAKQDRSGDTERSICMPILIHGDAAFAGQGLVPEVLNLSDLKGYRTGGTIHVIINNQIGFTTSPVDARSTLYATDIAKMLDIPIFHVNGEDAVAVAVVTRIAVEWRQTFKRDVVIDMYCYRKHGHNEGDEPSFTQPLEYEIIRSRPTPREVCANRLVESGLVSRTDADRIHNESRDAIESAGDERNPQSTPFESPLRDRWMKYVNGDGAEADTRVDAAKIVNLLTKANTVPEGFKAHPKLLRVLQQRLEMARGERPLDWAVGEQAAYATLVAEGWRVRLSGQDCGRGTFSHRHAVLTDITTGEEYFPVKHLTPDQGDFNVIDSSLSEAGVLGFEFGYSWDYPDALVMWEAQFGDFVNGAQVIIDQYLVAAEQKWGRLSGLVLLLPHGYEGQGPEHSSGRLERFLQSCAEDNFQVANCTTPANFYHLLRRQVLRSLRKPLVVMTPKSILRSEEAVSTVEELANGAFQHVIPETDALDPKGVRRVVFCSGKIYYTLRDARRKAQNTQVALVRLEMLYPFPAEKIREVLASYPSDAEVVWCQEEPRNMGAWPSVFPWLLDLLPNDRRPRYAGRKEAASPATGSIKKHDQEQAQLVSDALTL